MVHIKIVVVFHYFGFYMVGTKPYQNPNLMFSQFDSVVAMIGSLPGQ